MASRERLGVRHLEGRGSPDRSDCRDSVKHFACGLRGNRTVLLQELLVVGQADAVALLALGGRMAHRTGRRVAHAVSLAPVRLPCVMANDARRLRARARSFSTWHVSHSVEACDDVARKTRLHVVGPHPLRGGSRAPRRVAVGALRPCSARFVIDADAVRTHHLGFLMSLWHARQRASSTRRPSRDPPRGHHGNLHVERAAESRTRSVDRRWRARGTPTHSTCECGASAVAAANSASRQWHDAHPGCATAL